VLCSPGSSEHPRALAERRLMTDVLIVETGQLCDPVTVLVLMEAIDRSDHGHTVALRVRGERAALYVRGKGELTPGTLPCRES
jgi:hypothetical protein